MHLKGMAASGLGCRKALVGTGWTISLSLPLHDRAQRTVLLSLWGLTMKLFLGLHRHSLAASRDY